jgi:hypothetical protein
MDLRDTLWCQTCRRSLMRVTLGDRQWWEHQPRATEGPADHAVVPVDLGELHGPPDIRCDFCSGPDVVRVYACGASMDTEVKPHGPSVVGHDQVYQKRYQNRLRILSEREASRRNLQSTRHGMMDQGTEWAACGPCDALIDKADLLGLIFRVTEHLPVKMTRGKRIIDVRARLYTTYQVFFGTVDSRSPIDWYLGLGEDINASTGDQSNRHG